MCIALRDVLIQHAVENIDARIALFWSRVTKSDGCWIWTGSKSRGYGEFHIEGVLWKAHRLSWVLARSHIPRGLHVLHRCDTPNCVRPDHLFLGTHQENMQDRDAKGRNNRAGNPKLAMDQVRAIREDAKNGLTRKEISKKYNVSRETVWLIVTRRSWKGVA